MFRKSLFIIISLIYVVISIFFWYQSRRFERSDERQAGMLALQGGRRNISQKESPTKSVEQLVGFFQNRPWQEPVGSDPFLLPKEEGVEEEQTLEELAKLTLSSISWNRVEPLVVINNEILAEGDLVPDSQFKVLKIYPDSVILKLGVRTCELKLFPEE